MAEDRSSLVPVLRRICTTHNCSTLKCPSDFGDTICCLQDSRNFTRDPPSETNFDFAHIQSVAAALIEEDPNLRKIRFQLVPKQFIHYFHLLMEFSEIFLVVIIFFLFEQVFQLRKYI